MRVERNWQKKLRTPAAASRICDAPHICRLAGGLGFNSREVLWGDFGPSAARNKQAIVDSGLETKLKACTSHAAHPKFPIDRPDLKPIIAASLWLRDFEGQASRWHRCLLPGCADRPPHGACRRRIRPGNGQPLRAGGAIGR